LDLTHLLPREAWHALPNPIGSYALLAPFVDDLLARPLDGPEALEKWLADRSLLDAHLEEYAGWLYIRMTRNTADEEAAKGYEHFYSELYPPLAANEDKLNRRFADVWKNHPLPNPAYKVYVRDVMNRLALHRDINIPLEAEMHQLEREYGNIASAMRIDYGGKNYSMQEAQDLLELTDREVRKEVYDLLAERRLQDKDTLDALLSKLIALRNQIALNAGYANFRDYAFAAMGRFDYSPQDCLDFHEAVAQKVVPLVEKMAVWRKKTMGLDVLRPYDLKVDAEGKAPLKPYETPEELLDKTTEVLSQLRPAWGNMVEQMRSMGRFDLDARINKAPGGYNYPLPESGVPFIFMNGTGSMDDITTMMHECGHAIHAFLVQPLKLNAFRNVPTEMAEVASTTMELLSMKYWELLLPNADDLKRARRQQLEKGLLLFPWVALVDAFQHWLYTKPEHTAEERHAMWASLFAKFQPSVVDWTGYEAFAAANWQRQLHIFEVPFYYIEYAICQLAAFALWAHSLENEEATLQAYEQALALGNTCTLPELYEAAGIRFAFDAAYLGGVMEAVEKELDRM